VSTAKVSTTLDSERVREAKARVGERGFSRYLDDALARALQRDRLADLEEELTAAYGAIPDEIQEVIDATPWPR
jgi:hypothetical protein